MQLKKATKEKCKLRMMIAGLPGSGKTYSALEIATNLVPNGKILLLDSEYGSASKYADKFNFYSEELTNHDPRNYIKMIKEIDTLGIDVLVLDSITHAWHALLNIATEEGKKSRTPFGGWDKATPIQREFVEAILASKCHVIATARTKSDYVIEANEKGKMEPKKVGTKVESKENIEYEFDIAGEIDSDHSLRITKSRCSDVDGKIFYKPGKEFAGILRNWLDSGIEPVEKEVPKSVGAAEESGETVPVQGPASVSPKERPGADETAHLLKAAQANGWSVVEVSNFCCKSFNLAAGTITGNLTWKQWELAVKIVSCPENKCGNVVVSPEPELLQQLNSEK